MTFKITQKEKEKKRKEKTETLILLLTLITPYLTRVPGGSRFLLCYLFIGSYDLSFHI
jgi:hypothetical protein